MDNQNWRSYEIRTRLGPRKVVVWPGDPSLAPYIIVGGYCQSVLGMAMWFMSHVIGKPTRTVIAVERLGVGTDARPRYLGWWGLQHQLQDLIAIIETLVAQRWWRDDLKPLWIGHSLGAHLIAELRLIRPDWFGGAVLIAPPAISPLALLLHLRLWVGGGCGLPFLLWSVLTGRGCHCPSLSSRYAFAGQAATAEELDTYRRTQQRDAGVLFFQVLLGYGWLYGKGLRQLRVRSLREEVTIVGCWHDWIMPQWGTRRTAAVLQAPLLWLNAAHCFWVHNPEDRSNIATLQEAMHHIST